jgi:hypothetical protein
MAMSKIFIIISLKKIKRCLLPSVPLLFITSFLLLILSSPIKHTQVMGTSHLSEIGKLKKENEKLKDLIDSILPDEKTIIYEDNYRNRFKAAEDIPFTNFKEYPLSEVLEKGIRINFNKTVEHPDYERLVYDPSWIHAYYRGWIYLPQKNIEARHRLFIAPLGLSAAYDMEGSLGLNKTGSVDAHRNINFIIFDFNVEDIIKFHQQIALKGAPRKSGMQVVSIRLKDALPEGKDMEEFLFQLSTPAGYEIDYLFQRCGKSEYYKKLEKWETTEYVFAGQQEENNLDNLKNENKLLKEKLFRFVPPGTEAVSREKCRPGNGTVLPGGNTGIKTLIEKSNKIPFEISFRNSEYKRPVYHPFWKENLVNGWSYVPRKICENMRRLFPIPQDDEKRHNMLGSLAFYEEYSKAEADEYSILAYGFYVEEVSVPGSSIIIIGQPARTGAQIITISKSFLQAETGQSGTVHLVTRDGCEVDYAVIK